MEPNNVNGNYNGEEPGKNTAIASMILGIVGVILLFTGGGSLVSFIMGIIGMILASKSKSEGYNGGMRTAGFVLSLICLIAGIIVFIACVICAGVLGAAGLLGSM